MARTLYFDCRCGAAGDMLLAALLDLGAPREKIIASLRTLNLGDWQLTAERVLRGGVSATRVVIAEPSHPHRHDGDRHGDHHHHHPAAPGRKLADFLEALARADFSTPVKARAEKVFRLLAAVEGKIHGASPDEIHFHEISGIDSLLDVCGVCLALDYLAVEKIIVSPLQVGGGMVACAHGLMPVPAPATLAILQQFHAPFAAGLADKELLTPTGAALLATLGEFAPLPPAQVAQIGYGAGAADFSTHSNTARALLLTPSREAAASAKIPAASIHDATAETLGEIRFAVDDVSGEILGWLQEKLFAAGALDVYALPAQMKKNRPGVEMVILLRPEQRDAVCDLIFSAGVSLGLRYQEITRVALARRWEEVAGQTARVKIGTWRGRDVFAKPEYEDWRKTEAPNNPFLRGTVGSD
ncbi:MAG: nickel pincer cofactor biosynthesis protein LarC [Planctomycetota bacterium]|jgi:uncharacterized protein (TIGR00299 family) protein|nr:nickel pincer cofactor biosynthesis protein LarC [Planctomycetota bacterium]